jgi:hypothetical protein
LFVPLSAQGKKDKLAIHMFNSDVFSFSYRLLRFFLLNKYIIFQKCCHKRNEAHKTTIYKANNEELVYKLHSSIYPIQFIVVMYLPSAASYFNFGINLGAVSDNIHSLGFNVLITMKVREITPCKMRGSHNPVY